VVHRFWTTLESPRLEEGLAEIWTVGEGGEVVDRAGDSVSVACLLERKG